MLQFCKWTSSKSMVITVAPRRSIILPAHVKNSSEFLVKCATVNNSWFLHTIPITPLFLAIIINSILKNFMFPVMTKVEDLEVQEFENIIL